MTVHESRVSNFVAINKRNLEKCNRKLCKEPNKNQEKKYGRKNFTECKRTFSASLLSAEMHREKVLGGNFTLSDRRRIEKRRSNFRRLVPSRNIWIWPI